MKYDIFISYRREGGAQYARILKAELEKRGYRDRVFLDYDELKDGRFDSRIMAAIDSAKVFVFILSPGSLDRCLDEKDWVRQEILYAIEHERHIIPVNFDGLFKSFPPYIPEEIRVTLGQHQFSKIDSESLLDASIDKLIRERIAPVAQPQVHVDGTADITVISDADCTVEFFGRTLAKVKACRPTPLPLKKGNYVLEFKSDEDSDVSVTKKYIVSDTDFVDFIEIHLREKIVANLRLHRIKENDKFGFADESKCIVIPCIYKTAYDFSEGLASVENDACKWGFINKKGDIVIPFIYRNTLSAFCEGLVGACDDNHKWGFIDRNGLVVLPFIYDFVYSFSEGLAAVDINKRKGFIDKSGKLVIPAIYKNTGNFNEGLSFVCNDEGKYGFIDKNGRVIIPLIFKLAFNFCNGLAKVQDEKGFYGLIDKTGRLVVDCIYKLILDYSGENIVVFTENMNKLRIDRTGKIL